MAGCPKAHTQQSLGSVDFLVFRAASCLGTKMPHTLRGHRPSPGASPDSHRPTLGFPCRVLPVQAEAVLTSWSAACCHLLGSQRAPVHGPQCGHECPHSYRALTVATVHLKRRLSTPDSGAQGSEARPCDQDRGNEAEQHAPSPPRRGASEVLVRGAHFCPARPLHLLRSPTNSRGADQQ